MEQGDAISRSEALDILSSEFDIAAKKGAETDDDYEIAFNAGEMNCARRATRNVWTVSIKDRKDEDMDIWTASFSSETKADEFKAKVEKRLKGYGVFETVDVCKDFGCIDDEMYLDWLDDRYGVERS